MAIREILQFRQIDPDVLAARRAAEKLLGAFRLLQDPRVKRSQEMVVLDAFVLEKELILKFLAKGVIKTLHELEAPEVSKN